MFGYAQFGQQKEDFGLDNRQIVTWLPVQRRADRPWGPHIFLLSGGGGFFPCCKNDHSASNADVM